MLEEFHKKFEKDFLLDDLSESLKEDIWKQCETILNNEDLSKIPECLSCLKILSRHEKYRKYLTSQCYLSKLVDFGFPYVHSNDLTDESRLDGLKILSNIIFKESHTISFLKSQDILQKLLDFAVLFISNGGSKHVLLIHLKILFIMSGLCDSIRKELDELFDTISIFIKMFKIFEKNDLLLLDLEIMCEALKCLYNILYACKDQSSQTKSNLNELVILLRNFLVQDISDNGKWLFYSQIVNVLNVIPEELYIYLLFDNDNSGDTSHVLQHKSVAPVVNRMSAIQMLIAYLDIQLEIIQPSLNSNNGNTNNTTMGEKLSPIFSCLIRACKSNREIRKYCRLKILPYLAKEVERLPEEGDTIRNRMCRLLTNLHPQVSELAGLLIYILCKENISRAIKYSGFGNFAGFLARNALLSPSKTKSFTSEEYSSTSDSETEEFAHLRENVNPVTGRWEKPQPNPMEGMSDEQKEYLAMELVQQIDKLERCGVIQPGTVSDDGQVKPVNHILELLDTKQKLTEKENACDDESDD